LFFQHSTSQTGDFTITHNDKKPSDGNPEEIKERLRTPKHWKNEKFAVVESIFAGSRMKVACSDGVSRLARIPGGKRRTIKRIRDGNGGEYIVIISEGKVFLGHEKKNSDNS